jgi:hypothetical protein
MIRGACVASLALLAACGIPSQGPTMQPGRDCQECHNRGDGSPSFTAAGTVFTNPGDATGAGVEGVRVVLTGTDGRTVTVKSNQSGNFYTRESLAFPLTARLEGNGVTRVMSDPVPHGECNFCHNVPPVADSGLAAPTGRIALIGGGTGDEFMNPGDDCLACHDGRAAKAWSVAGTVYANGQGAAGVTVRLRNPANGAVVLELTSNRVGNFFSAAPIPVARPGIEIQQGSVVLVIIEIQQGSVVLVMGEGNPSPPVSCNGCHGRGSQGPVSITGGGGG